MHRVFSKPPAKCMEKVLALLLIFCSALAACNGKAQSGGNESGVASTQETEAGIVPAVLQGVWKGHNESNGWDYTAIISADTVLMLYEAQGRNSDTRTFEVSAVTPAANTSDNAKAEFPQGWSFNVTRTVTSVPNDASPVDDTFNFFPNTAKTKFVSAAGTIYTKQSGAVATQITQKAQTVAAEAKKPAEVAPESDFEVSLNKAGDGAVIDKYVGPGGNIIIPATIQGFPVVSVDMNPTRNVKGESYTYVYRNPYNDDPPSWREANREVNTTLLSVVIPEGVRWVGGFYDCVSLRSVTLPNSVKTIADSAFERCYNLVSVTIPDSVTAIGHLAFSRTGISSVTIPGGVMHLGDNNRYDSGGVFQDCASLETVTILKGVPAINGFMFSGCARLASVVIPDSVTLIGANAFSNCTSLAAIVIPDSVTDIGDTPAMFTSGETFANCASLENVTISPVKRKMRESTFANCPKLSLASQAAIRAAMAAAK